VGEVAVLIVKRIRKRGRGKENVQGRKGEGGMERTAIVVHVEELGWNE
jgi:hypothetical protein